MADSADLARSLGRMHLTLARLLADAVGSSGIPREQLLEAAELSDDELNLMEEGDTSDFSGIAALLSVLDYRLVLDPDFVVSIEPASRRLPPTIRLQSHPNVGDEPNHSRPTKRIAVEPGTQHERKTTTATDSSAIRELSHAGR